MAKYKVLVADDEQMIRRGIISFLKRYEDFEVVCEAEDGEMALDMARMQDISVYFVDIMMPFLNGLEFVRALQEVHPQAIVVIITGYDRFEYAKDALSLGVFDYVLKPIRDDSFDEMMQRLRLELQRQDRLDLEQKYMTWAKDKLKQQREMLIQSFLRKLLQGNISKEEIARELEYLDLFLPMEYRMYVIRDDYRRGEDYRGYWNEALLHFTLQNVAKEVFAGLECETCCDDEEGNIILLTGNEEDDATKERLARYHRFISSRLPARCRVVAKTGIGPENLSVIYRAALRSLRQQSEYSDAMMQVLDFVEENYQREDLALQDLATEVNLSVPYLSKMIRKEMGMTFVDYLTNLRMRKAIDLMQDDTIKMYEIAERVGYASQHYFSNVFKKKMGMSPNDYKRSIHDKEPQSDFTKM